MPDVYLPKQRKILEVVIAPEEIVQIKDEQFS